MKLFAAKRTYQIELSNFLINQNSHNVHTSFLGRQKLSTWAKTLDDIKQFGTYPSTKWTDDYVTPLIMLQQDGENSS